MEHKLQLVVPYVLVLHGVQVGVAIALEYHLVLGALLSVVVPHVHRVDRDVHHKGLVGVIGTDVQYKWPQNIASHVLQIGSVVRTERGNPICRSVFQRDREHRFNGCRGWLSISMALPCLRDEITQKSTSLRLVGGRDYTLLYYHRTTLSSKSN